MKKTTLNQDDIIALHNEANEIFKIPVDKRSTPQKVRLEEIMNVIRLENEKYDEEKQNFSMPPEKTINKWMDVLQMKFIQKALETPPQVETGDYAQISARLGPNNYNIKITNIEDFHIALAILQTYVKQRNMQ